MTTTLYCTRFASIEQARAFASIPLGAFDAHEELLRSIGFDEMVDEAEWLASEVAECLLLIRSAAMNITVQNGIVYINFRKAGALYQTPDQQLFFKKSNGESLLLGQTRDIPHHRVEAAVFHALQRDPT